MAFDVEQATNLADMNLDLCPLSRKVAPLKTLNLKSLKGADRSVYRLNTSTEEEDLYNFHMFHHINGLTNLRKRKFILLISY